ncbi:glycoside hydrolase family 43 protein [Bipolaris zeicola 26-R-13]|uniref:Glycoside hydrolase family 43 protein n=1 Tax=Cochliobolus carbonum (strain 26-R-13) TaxID=930089 RepID=W6XUW0_COCC2|nr:glycoside hydrolase family 43 protein [Bipolaris zeicola 26-R-13]EUC31212.1 glycoside hydrolase family 43 protein [Bipolaris zeicola 26-R-13]
MRILMIKEIQSLTVILGTVRGNNVTHNNPILPGWHSDSSCVFVPEFDNTFFCTTSSFMALASNALSRVAQLPEVQTATNEQFTGMLANTLRYHKGKFYPISAWINTTFGVPRSVLSTATDPFDDSSWSDYLFVQTSGFTIDPDIFFDDDGTVVVASSGSPIQACYLDMTTGNTSKPWPLWNGTGGASAEGPHIFKKDGYYYLLIAEGGTQLGHRASMARAMNLTGPWEASPNNPLVSNSGTNEYFQTVGHVDLFQDGKKEVPSKGWPYADQVRGKMQGPLQKRNSLTPSKGLSIARGAPDVVDSSPGSKIPPHWIFWRAPFNSSTFQISPKGHPNQLQIQSARANLTADAQLNASREGLSAVFRRQEHIFFNYTVDLHPNFGKSAGDELGGSNFLNQDQHVDLGIVYLNNTTSSGALQPYFRFRANSVRYPIPQEKIEPIPQSWLTSPIHIHISPNNKSSYSFFASPSTRSHEERHIVDYSTALLAGDGAGSGGLVGVYATTNGNSATFRGYMSRWRCSGVAQKIDYDTLVSF